MSAGRANRDLGRILHDPKYARAKCSECRWVGDLATKEASIREARAHVAATTHDVTITITHWQRVRFVASHPVPA